MIIPIIVAYITACLLGLYFLYRHWLNTPPDTWPEKWRGNQRNPRKNRLEPFSEVLTSILLPWERTTQAAGAWESGWKPYAPLLVK